MTHEVTNLPQRLPLPLPLALLLPLPPLFLRAAVLPRMSAFLTAAARAPALVHAAPNAGEGQFMPL